MHKVTVTEAINRGINFFAISSFGIIGIASLHEFIEEEDTTEKMDDSFVVVEALVAAVWYRYSGKAIKRTLIPFYFLFVGFITKAIGIYLDNSSASTHSSNVAYFGILGMIILVFLYQYYKYRGINKKDNE